MNNKQSLKILYVIAGFTAIGLGCIGIVLPIMPTTPFLLLALFCFGKGSKRFYLWFSSTKLYKNYVNDFIKTRAMKLKTKVNILVMASIVLIIAIIISPYLWLKGLIIVLMGIKYYYFLFRIKTLKKNTNSTAIAVLQKEELSKKSFL